MNITGLFYLHYILNRWHLHKNYIYLNIHSSAVTTLVQPLSSLMPLLLLLHHPPHRLFHPRSWKPQSDPLVASCLQASS